MRKRSVEAGQCRKYVWINSHLNSLINFVFFPPNVPQWLENNTYQIFSSRIKFWMLHITMSIVPVSNLLCIMSIIVTCVSDLWDLRVCKPTTYLLFAVPCWCGNWQLLMFMVICMKLTLRYGGICEYLIFIAWCLARCCPILLIFMAM